MVRDTLSDMATNKTSRADVGITTYVKSTLMRGQPFTRRGGGRVKASRGLCIGRAIDTQFSRYVTGELKLVPSSRKHARLYHIARVLRCSGIRMLATQVPVTLMGISTRIDGVGVRGSEVVVVELKTTQYARDAHAKLYTQPCGKHTVLSNGLPNTEESHHHLQCAFGVLGVHAALPTGTHVRGVVVVSYDGDAVLHKTPARYVSRKWFAETHRGSVRATSSPGFTADAWPSMDNARTRTAVGCADAEHVGANCVRLEGSRVALCVCERWGAARASKKKNVAALLLKTAKRIFKLHGVQCTMHVLAPFRKSWRLHEIASPCPRAHT